MRNMDGYQSSNNDIRIPENTRMGTVGGVDDHFYFDCRDSIW